VGNVEKKSLTLRLFGVELAVEALGLIYFILVFTIFSLMNTTYLNRDIRNNFPAIDDALTRLYSTGSVELQEGLYVTEEDLIAEEEKFKNYSFLSC